MKKLYPDRGMLKWRGLTLAEQTEMYAKLKREEEKEAPPLYLDEQALEEMQRIMMESYNEHRVIELQVNTFGLPYVEGKGIVTSLQPQNGRLLLTDGSYCVKDIVTIRFAD
ncbi:YolD-like family protein [Domibacillus indicus]|uniref:YolD-like family protein n=1 Tax=Domibacillus indicus TaxID=1437523 RepID=UPI00203CB7E5|nr:YolD-like family protein [Domibacillus indicus]MCM3789397.1 YolD-like family protein [Domibacillus indicus]